MRYNILMVRVRRLVWDAWNIAHITRHDVTPEEVEDVCHTDALVQEGKKGRLLIIGLSKVGKMLTVIVDPEAQENVYYVTTARSTSKKERRLYTAKKGSEK